MPMNDVKSPSCNSLPEGFPSRGCSMAARRNVRYSRLSTEDGDDNNLTEGNVDLRFTYTPKSLRRIPWKSIALAIFLLLLGTSLLFLSYFIFTGHMEGDNSQAYGLLFLGFLAFLPGTSFLLKHLHGLISFQVFMRLESLTIHGEEHQDTPLRRYLIISFPSFLSRGQ
ncbi:hypothetical protein PR202_ga31050 [Eleusine coracana subsp. coracana]|uniref:Transmembrane protein 230 n=1 Tax=Eleusine coracana subsp. coracana TaxID=191504 RepID=A0AAV5DPZ5_ELECO|nr:hypothetical protein PR202_ga31050 [Eleusine coracana subsp. coracana]